MSKLSSKLKEEFLALLPRRSSFRGPAHRRVCSRVDAEGNRDFARIFGVDGGRRAHSWQGGVNRGHAAGDQSLSRQTADLQRAWKTLIYLVISALIIIWSVSSISGGKRRLGGWQQKLLAEMVWPHCLAIQIILFVLIAMYCTIHELVRVIGKEKLLRIFFGPLPVPQV